MAADVKYTGSEQLVKARYFKRDTDQEPMFSGLVPKEYAQDRAKGLRWLELKAAADAEAEARKAEAEAAAASTTAAPDPLVLIGDLEGQLAEARGALESLQQSQADLVIATPEMVLSNAGQIHRVAGLAADIEAQSVAHQQQANQLMEQVAAKQAELETLIGNLAATAGALQADTREAITGFVADGQRRLSDSISKRITGFELAASKLRGPKGSTGAPGMSVATVPTDPRKMSAEALEQRFRRAVIPGDQAEQQTPDGLVRWTWTGQAWEQSSIVPAKVVVESRNLSVLDQSSHTQTAQTISKSGGSGGSATDRLLPGTDSVAPNVRTKVGDTANYTANSFADPKVGVLRLSVTALDGPASGKAMTLEASIVMGAGPGDMQVSIWDYHGSLLDSERANFSVDVDAVRNGAISIPTGVAGRVTAVPGATSTEILVNIANGSASQYALAGGVEWFIPPSNGAKLPTDAQPTPAWVW